MTFRLVLPGYRPASWNDKITGWKRQDLRRSADVAVGLAVRQLAEPPKFRRQVNILFVVYWGPKERRRDPDNLRAKPVIDSLRDIGVLVNDDPEWVYTYSARSLRDNKNPRTEIEITVIDAD